MNTLHISDLEVELAFAQNIYFSTMIFECGDQPEKPVPGGALDFGQADLIDDFFSRETEVSLVDWAAVPAGTQ